MRLDRDFLHRGQEENFRDRSSEHDYNLQCPILNNKISVLQRNSLNKLEEFLKECENDSQRKPFINPDYVFKKGHQASKIIREGNFVKEERFPLLVEARKKILEIYGIYFKDLG